MHQTPEIDPAWLDRLYQEAWRQYTHEDSLIQPRSNVFIGIQAALFALLAGLAWPIMRTGALGLFSFGVLAIIVGVFSLAIASCWCTVIEASREYVNLRWLSAAAIERLLDFRILGIAELEKNWRANEQSGNNPQDENYFPFKSVNPRLADLKIPRFQGDRGTKSIFKLIRTCRYLAWALVIFGGIIIAIFGVKFTSQLDTALLRRATLTPPAIFNALFLLVAVVVSALYGWKAFDAFEVKADHKPWAWWVHQRWFNFAGSLFGWAALWFVVRKAWLCIEAGQPGSIDFWDAAIAATAFVGITGHVPYAVAGVLRAIEKLALKALDALTKLK